MLLRAVLVLVAVAFSLPAATNAILIRRVNVVDTISGRALPERWVLISGKEIRRIGTGTFTAPKGTIDVDGAHKYLIPGLWDMNVHLWFKQNLFPLYLAAGVTGVRDMGSDPLRTRQWRRDVVNGSLPGPHVETCGVSFDGVPSSDPKLPVLVPRSPADARRLYDQVDGDGVDFIRVLSRLHADSYYALIDRGRKWGLPVTGYVPDEISVQDAIDARQRSMEELVGVPLACSREEDKLRLMLLKAEQTNDGAKLAEVAARVLDTFDPGRAERLFHRMAVFDCWQTPTLAGARRTLLDDSATLTGNPELKRIPREIRREWKDPRGEDMPAPPTAGSKRLFDLDCAIVNRMQAAGVPLLAGSGAGQPWSSPGSELHDELEELVKAGLTPAQALRAATISAAKYLDAEDSLGSVEPGKIADLVLLTADPLVDIRNARKVAAVFLGGRYLPKAKLDEMAAGVK